MKRVMWLSLLVLAVALTALALCPGTMKCPLHDGWIANYTGTRMLDGVLIGVYHCLRQVIDDVAFFVHLAALDESRLARLLAHRGSQRLAAIQNVKPESLTFYDDPGNFSGHEFIVRCP